VMLPSVITRNISDEAMKVTNLPSPLEGEGEGEENVYRGNINHQ
jgi:hypothetical protein